MRNGRFTKEERAYLESLDAVEEVRATSIIYSRQFKIECMRRYEQGERPSDIFASVGLASSLIGYKRIERAIYHWKEAQRKDALGTTDVPQKRHRRRIDTMKKEKQAAIERQRAIRTRRICELEEKMKRREAQARTREEKIITAQAAKIAALEAQVKALKALGTLAKKSQCAPQMTNKATRFALIFQLRCEDPSLNISAACQALEVSRRGYYDWMDAAPLRAAREQADLQAKDQVQAAYNYRGYKKGSRQVVDCLRRKQNVIMNRKKVIRISRKYELAPKRKRKHPYRVIDLDGLPKVAPNVVNRNFRRGAALKVLSTDITYLPNKDGFSFVSGIIDCQTGVVLAHTISTSLKEKFVLDTYDQLKNYELPKDVWSCSDQGCHYTARAFRNKLAELGIHQSMSRKACCWDNAPIESFWGRMKDEIGPTKHLSHAEVVALVDDYIDYYNNERGQARLGWLTPVQYASRLAV